MSYKTILVHVNSDSRSKVRIELAIALAQRFDAHLVGFNLQPVLQLPLYVAADPLIIEHQVQAEAKEMAAAAALFQTATAPSGLAGIEWRAYANATVDAILQQARYADLLVLGQRDPSETWAVAPDFADNVLLAAGRPVIVVPYAGAFNDIGKRVLVAWNGTREAARAVTDAIPLLQEASQVQVLTVNAHATAQSEIAGADIGLYLSRHGVRVQVTSHEAISIDVGNELLSRAADFSADLLVMGAYGHSRARELVMGGATRTIIDSMTVPALMSH